MKRILFLCSGNYYRSRFAEIYFNWLVRRDGLPWTAFSRGLAVNDGNPGPISRHTARWVCRLGIDDDSCERWPLSVTAADFAAADHVVAVKRAEHERMMQGTFAAWLDRVEFWDVHDVDCAPPEIALPHLEREVGRLVYRLCRAAA
jgi:protein-tyrosine phosphatase